MKVFQMHKKPFHHIILMVLLAVSLLMGCASQGNPASGGAEDKQELVVVTKDAQSGGQTSQVQEVAPEEVPEETKEAIQEEVPETLTESESREDAGDALVDADGKFANGSPYTRDQALKLYFRKKSNRDQHYEKHGIEMGFKSAEDYLQAAREVVANPNALHKIEKEDGDDVYFIEETSEFVVVSSDGYLRTYFIPGAGKKYYDRQ